uniref:Uncharacterized protein n=1 Tax=Rhipicephalus zambeziensis TaxID=60191 RepID=A0A224YE06_9ACAR
MKEGILVTMKRGLGQWACCVPVYARNPMVDETGTCLGVTPCTILISQQLYGIFDSSPPSSDSKVHGYNAARTRRQSNTARAERDNRSRRKASAGGPRDYSENPLSSQSRVEAWPKLPTLSKLNDGSPRLPRRLEHVTRSARTAPSRGLGAAQSTRRERRATEKNQLNTRRALPFNQPNKVPLARALRSDQSKMAIVFFPTNVRGANLKTVHNITEVESA